MQKRKVFFVSLLIMGILIGAGCGSTLNNFVERIGKDPMVVQKLICQNIELYCDGSTEQGCMEAEKYCTFAEITLPQLEMLKGIEKGIIEANKAKEKATK